MFLAAGFYFTGTTIALSATAAYLTHTHTHTHDIKIHVQGKAREMRSISTEYMRNIPMSHVTHIMHESRHQDTLDCWGHGNTA